MIGGCSPPRRKGMVPPFPARKENDPMKNSWANKTKKQWIICSNSVYSFIIGVGSKTHYKTLRYEQNNANNKQIQPNNK